MYCTKNDILNELNEEELIQICDAVHLTGAEQTAKVDGKVNQAIEDACSKIDSYAGVKYAVPLATQFVTKTVRKSSAIITLYYLWSSRSSKTGMDETVKDNFEKEIAFWKDVSKGIASIGVDPPPANNSLKNAKVVSNERVFTNKTMNGF